ncbi:hypothetical protein PL263_16310 [Methylomonas sp. EFPC3]|uniref:hypothetical protein n=1 Tax=Methylomonas sp. EFPC3 TaxID=3021710 RepID=UPI002415D394|nr:hypothetical protein [Methylomonas sp. EFPC3]WFP49651.1 hypothetical protein PL263_16310 [Methylomonas sp. EFPC3]
MAYNRPYGLDEVHRILCDSEGRPRPDLAAAVAKPGHAISLHTEAREDFFRAAAPSYRRKIRFYSVRANT